MTSRFSQRATGVAAATAIVLLVILIVLLWTNVGQEFFHNKPSPARKEMKTDSSRQNNVISASDFRTTYSDDELFSTISDLGQSKDPQMTAQTEQNKQERPISREYVKPIKISPLGLHQDDLLYGSDQLTGENPEPLQLRHHSGHFRHKTAKIWDPHPMYEFTAFKKKFNLVLEHDSKFVSPDLQVTHVWHNTSETSSPNTKSNGCWYKGYVKGDRNSSVIVSLCHGMTGIIRTSTGSYHIQPSEQSSDHAKPIEHVMSHVSLSGVRGVGRDFHHCGLMDDYDHSKNHKKHNLGEVHSKNHPDIDFDYDSDYLHQVHSGTRGEDPDEHSLNEKNLRKRSKRSISEEYFVEMLVVADSSMASYHGGDVENYILALMYIVSGIFKDASIGNPITIALVKLEILHHKNFAQHRYPPHDGVSAAEMLREFCKYQASFSSDDHDTALLLTRENICRNASAQKCETLGLAELGTMCDRKSSCSLVQDNGLSAAFTIAHELGHVLNMPHDDAEMKCRPDPYGDSVSHVMSTSLKEGTDPWSWSECSRHFLTEFLDSRNSHCLKDPPIKDYITENGFSDLLPGETIEGNRQCELLYGEGSRICSYMPVCSALWCHKVDSEGCQTLHMPWGDGTPCGEGAWCQKGVCVQKNRKALEKVDGGWGAWQGFGSCSRTCGGGVKKSYRECNNPRPQNGGKYCTGRRVRYKSCGTRDCPEGSKGFREAQCSAFDYNSHKIHGVPSTVRWIPKYGLTGDDRCILYCRVYQSNLYYPLKEKVIDGTPCAPESFDICVNGQCKPAGCDHILSSDVRLDQCGKCGGNNDTCRVIQGFFNSSAEEQGYRTVVRIPAGSSNLDIRQHGIYGARDDNYLVLKDGVTGGRLLNNENVLTTFRKLIFYDGVTLEYSGCLSPVERINASRPLKRDLLLEVLSAGSLTPPDISYQYTVPKNNEVRYMWRHLDDEWESCDQVCNGERKRVLVCVSLDSNEIVAENYCSSTRKPHPIVEECNTNCVLKWRITGRTECSSNCGPGIRMITKECVQEIVGHPEPYPVRNSSCLHLPNPPPEVEKCEGPCNVFNWKYADWSLCSKTCGSGIQIREAYCADELNRRVSEDKCDPSERIKERVCQPQACPTWSVGEWSQCSVTCGIGIQTRGRWCQVDNQVIDISYCNAKKMPEDQKKCVMLCLKWSFSEWGVCSTTCGEGQRRRTLFCKTSEGKVVEDKLCHGKPKPPEKEFTERCKNQPCPIQNFTENNSVHRDYNLTYRRRSKFPQKWKSYGHEYKNVSWFEGPWKSCSKSCGTGTQQRLVTCRLPSGTYLEDRACSHLPKPPDLQPCILRPCHPMKKKFRWKTGPWSSCSKTCGRGEKTRIVKCVRLIHSNNSIQNSDWMNEAFCERLNKPKETRKCSKKFCPLTWIKGEWSKCSRECGEGIQNRTITCHQVNSYDWLDPVPLSNDKCNGNERPATSRICKIRDCDAALYWSPEKWMPCSTTCGKKGIQRMEYKCRNRHGMEVHESECRKNDITKPQPKSKPCNRRPCNITNCKELQLHTHARSDGEYSLLVGGKTMSMYCKGMNTNSPTEYLTLPNPNDNYSKFATRLQEFAYRYSESNWFDDCFCSKDTEAKTGYTLFKKVRLFVETLEIDTQDFTFADQISGRPIGFAEAGDCCNDFKCMQGTFRVNITGTDLLIASTQDWVSTSPMGVKMDIDKQSPQVVVGRCGGYCGSCIPARNGRLKLQVQPP